MFEVRNSRSGWRKASLVWITLLLVLLLTACSGGSANTTPTPTSSSTQYTTIPLNLPAAAYSGQLIGPIPASTQLQLGVSFKVNSSVLAQSQGKIPSGKNVDVSTIANEYGISDETFQKIKAYLGVADVTLNLGKLHSYMSVTARASTIEELFQTQFLVYKQNNREYYVPAASMAPKLPSFVMSYVVAITGLESYYTLSPGLTGLAANTTPLKPSNKAADCTITEPDTLLPQDIASAYSYNQFYKSNYTGKRVTINLVELGGLAQSDLANYFACVDFPVSQFGYKDIIQPAAQPDPGGTEEAALDIEMIAGLAPGANIMDYEAAIPSPQQAGLTANSEFELLNGALQAIIDDNIIQSNGVNLVSISYGGAENYLDPNVVNAINQSLETLVSAEHMTVFVSTGDCGAFGGKELNQLAVQFPSTDSWATAVGGTELTVNRQGARSGEVVWGNPHPSGKVCTNNDWGTGGGVSKDFTRPSWQQGAGVTNRYSKNARQVPDLVAAATNIPIYIDGQWAVVGGTSAATPIWASGMALVEQALLDRTKQFVYGPSLFYIVADQAAKDHPYFDVTRGNNLFYTASPNWDDASGWGAPNLVSFYNAIVSLM